MTTSAPTPAKADETTDLREVLFFCSYCGEDNPNCSDARPCPTCLGMCNVFKVNSAGAQYVRELAPEWLHEGPPVWGDLRSLTALLSDHASALSAASARVEAVEDARVKAHRLATTALLEAQDWREIARIAEARADRLAAENAVLVKALSSTTDALANMMGFYDSPVSRRRYPPHEMMQEAIRSGREALPAARAALPEAITPKETSDGQN